MKKTIAITFFSLLFFFVGFTSLSAEETTEFDYRNGLLDKISFDITGSDHYEYENAIDNDLTTFSNIHAIDWITFDRPVNLEGVFVKLDGGSVSRLIYYYYDTENERIMNTSYRVSNLDSNGEYFSIDIENVLQIRVADNGYTLDIYEIDFFGTYSEAEIPEDLTAPGEIVNLDYTAENNRITLNWNNPTDEDFSKVNVYVDGELVGNTGGNSYTIEGLEENTDYAIRLTTLDEIGNESQGIELNVTTETKPLPPPEKPEDLPEIRDLKIEADPERVDLSWKNPPQYFEKAKIYRKVTGATTASVLSKLNPFAPIELQASGDFEPLFETNGTTFADLSIEPEESYEYKVTNFYNGMESNGVTVQTSIPKPPLVDTSGLKLPFGVGALIESGNGLIALIGGFVLLALAFIFVPKVIALIRQSFSGGASASNGSTVATGARLTERQQKIVTTGGRQPREPRQGRG